jgi:hypothetical protein
MHPLDSKFCLVTVSLMWWKKGVVSWLHDSVSWGGDSVQRLMINV